MVASINRGHSRAELGVGSERTAKCDPNTLFPTPSRQTENDRQDISFPDDNSNSFLHKK